jgi:two-component system sensor histidine kinase VicK
LGKQARRELEKLNEAKNQFIMITQHHLRTPVTSIEWELGSMLGGTYGPTTPRFEAALRDTQTDAARLNRIIDDFLNITTLKTGQNILNPSHRRLKPAIEEILRDLRSGIERKHITVTYPTDDSSWPELTIDFEKMRDILLIIVENAVTYNRQNGTIAISTKIEIASDSVSESGSNSGSEIGSKRFLLTIENTGLGITSEEIGQIGSALFYRGQAARKMNTVGMGVGLSVARAIIKAHHGTFEIESDGKDKGARVRVGILAL